MGRPHIVGSAVLSTTLPRNLGWKQAREQKIMRKDRGRDAQFTAAEKNGKGMALKSFMGAKPFQKTRISLVRGNGDASSLDREKLTDFVVNVITLILMIPLERTRGR